MRNGREAALCSKLLRMRARAFYRAGWRHTLYPEAMSMEAEKTVKTMHSMTLEGRTRAKLTGVAAVSCFNDQEIVLETAEGELALLGENLHIEQLDLDEGRLEVTGSISGLEYSEQPSQRARRGAFWRRKKG